MFITKDIAKRMKLEEKEEERKTYSPLRKFAKMVGHVIQKKTMHIYIFIYILLLLLLLKIIKNKYY